MKYPKGEPVVCPKCGFPTKETKELSMSSMCVCVEYVICVCVCVFVSL